MSSQLGPNARAGRGGNQSHQFQGSGLPVIPLAGRNLARSSRTAKRETRSKLYSNSVTFSIGFISLFLLWAYHEDLIFGALLPPVIDARVGSKDGGGFEVQGGKERAGGSEIGIRSIKDSARLGPEGKKVLEQAIIFKDLRNEHINGARQEGNEGIEKRQLVGSSTKSGQDEFSNGVHNRAGGNSGLDASERSSDDVASESRGRVEVQNGTGVSPSSANRLRGSASDNFSEKHNPRWRPKASNSRLERLTTAGGQLLVVQSGSKADEAVTAGAARESPEKEPFAELPGHLERAVAAVEEASRKLPGWSAGAASLGQWVGPFDDIEPMAWKRLQRDWPEQDNGRGKAVEELGSGERDGEEGEGETVRSTDSEGGSGTSQAEVDVGQVAVGKAVLDEERSERRVRGRRRGEAMQLLGGAEVGLACRKQGTFSEFVAGRSVVVVMHEASLTGAPLAVAELAGEMIGCGATVLAVVLNRKGGLIGEMGRRGIRVSRGKGEDSWRAAAAADLVVVGSAASVSWMAPYLSRYPTRASRVVWWMMENRREYFDLAKKQLGTVAAAVFIAQSQATTWQRWSQEDGVDLPDRTAVIPLSLGEDLARIAGIADGMEHVFGLAAKADRFRKTMREMVRRKMGLAEDDMLVAILSSVNPGKGQVYLVEAFLGLLSRGSGSGTEGVAAGLRGKRSGVDVDGAEEEEKGTRGAGRLGKRRLRITGVLEGEVLEGEVSGVAVDRVTAEGGGGSVRRSRGGGGGGGEHGEGNRGTRRVGVREEEGGERGGDGRVREDGRREGGGAKDVDSEEEEGGETVERKSHREDKMDEEELSEGWSRGKKDREEQGGKDVARKLLLEASTGRSSLAVKPLAEAELDQPGASRDSPSGRQSLAPWKRTKLLVGSMNSKSNKAEYVGRIQKVMRGHGRYAGGAIMWANATVNVAPLYAAADVYVMNAQGIGETFGRVTVEAMAFGLPVLGTDVGGTAEIVVPNKTGLLHPVGNRGVPILARHLDLLFHDRELALRMGWRGKQRVKELYLDGPMYSALAALFRDVLDGADGSRRK